MQVEERLPQVTRFPQRAKSAHPVENSSETGGKKQHVKRPSLELVDSHSFVTDEKDKNSKGPRIIDTELSKSELLDAVSKSSVDYASSTTDATIEDDEDTTPLMEKLAIDLYAILANENAKDDESKGDFDETTTANEDEVTTEGEEPTVLPITTTTTEATTTTKKITTTTEEPSTTELPKGRGGLGGSRNRFKFQPKGPALVTESPTEVSTGSTKPANRFSRPSSSFSSRNAGSRTTKTTNVPEEVKEEVSKSDAPSQSTSSKLGAKARNRFSLRNQSASVSTEKSVDAESTTAARLVKPRPQFSLRNRGRNGQPASTTESIDAPEVNTVEKEEKSIDKDAPIVPRPTSRLNLNRPTSRLLPGQKPRASHLNPRRNNTADENVETNKSANENESDFDTTTPNNLNKLKSRPRIQINADSKAAKKTTSPAAVNNRKINPLISKRKFGVTSTTGKKQKSFE